MKNLLLTILFMTSFLMGDNASGGGIEYYNQAKKAADQGKIKDAVKLMNKAVEQEPENSVYHCFLGDMCGTMAQKASIFSKFSWAKKCKKAYVKAVELDGDSIKARICLMRYLVMAPGIAGGSDELGQKHAEEAFRISPLMGKFAFAFIAKDEKKYSEAAGHIGEAAEIWKSRPEFPLKWGRKFAKQVMIETGYRLSKKKKYSEADKVLTVAVELCPDEFALHHYLGIVKEKMGNRKDALFHMKEAIKLNKKRNDNEKECFEYDTKVADRLEREVKNE